MAKKIKLKISPRLLKKKARRSSFGTRKNCRFLANPELVKLVDYKNVDFLKNFLTERGKILPSRISGNCAKYQRMVAREIKKARVMALVGYTSAEG